MTASLRPRDDVRRTGCDGKDWGYVATDINDPPDCISRCRERFLELLPQHETFDDVCQLLSDSRHMDMDQLFRMLYCCDSQLCGVNNLDGSGQDRMLALGGSLFVLS